MNLKRLPPAQDSRRLPETATAYLQTATHQARVPNGYREPNQDPQTATVSPGRQTATRNGYREPNNYRQTATPNATASPNGYPPTQGHQTAIPNATASPTVTHLGSQTVTVN